MWRHEQWHLQVRTGQGCFPGVGRQFQELNIQNKDEHKHIEGAEQGTLFVNDGSDGASTRSVESKNAKFTTASSITKSSRSWDRRNQEQKQIRFKDDTYCKHTYLKRSEEHRFPSHCKSLPVSVAVVNEVTHKSAKKFTYQRGIRSQWGHRKRSYGIRRLAVGKRKTKRTYT